MQPNVPQPPSQPPDNDTGGLFQPTVAPLVPQQSITAPIGRDELAPKHGRLKTVLMYVLFTLMLLGAVGFGIWAYLSRQDYKDNADKKAAAAVEVAKEAQRTELEKEFIEREKQPLTSYNGPATAGSVKISYPKTWSAFVTEDAQSATPVVGYFHPGFVPKIQGIDTVAFALRIEVANESYNQVLQQFESFVKAGTLTATPISLPKVPNVVGTLLKGKINPASPKVEGTLLVIPVRDKTMKLWTESNSAFGADYTTTIVPGLSFIP